MALPAPPPALAPACLPTFCARFERLLQANADKFGPGSHAVLLTRFQYLVALHEWVAENHDGDWHEARAVITRLAGHIVARYRELTIEGIPPPREELAGDPPLLVFGRSYYQERYAVPATALAGDIVCLERGPNSLRPGQVYLFVLDDEFRIRVCRRPLTLDNLIRQTNPDCADGVMVVHPMLVPERLAAYSAGELVLAGQGTVRAVVANTKSGHFRPPAASASLVRDAIAAAFPEAALITVLPVVMGERPAGGQE